MRADFYTANMEGERELVLTLSMLDGKVVGTFGSESLAEYVLSRPCGMNPGQVEGAVGPESGEEFLRRLPRNYSGHRLWAEVLE